MKTDIIKDLSYYVNLPYTITIRKDDEGDFVARIVELPGCLADGGTEAIAIENLRSMQSLWIEEALSSGHEIPEPDDDTELPSGKWLQRVPRRLHKGLVDLARRDNVSLNQLVTSMLSEALTMRSCAHAFETFIAARPGSWRPARFDCADLWLSFAESSHGEAEGWSTMPHALEGNLIQSLSWVKTIKQSHEVSVEPYADKHTKGHKQLTTK